MKNLVNILVKLWPRKYWILGITMGIMIIGLIIKAPTIKNNEYQINIEFYVVNISNNIKTDFNKYATLFVKNKSVLKTLSEKFNVKSPKISASFGKNKSIRFSVINSNPKLAKEIVNELVEMFNKKINSIVNEFVLFDLERIDYLIMLKQQQIDSLKQLLSGLYKQSEITYTPNSYLNSFDKSSLNNRSSTEKGVDVFTEETMLFNNIFEFNQQINQRNAIFAQLDLKNNYISIFSESDIENPEKVLHLLKLIIELFVLGIVVSISLFLIIDLGVPMFKSFWRQFLDDIKVSNKTV